MSHGVAGFRFSGIHSGVKSEGALDLGLIAAEQPVPAAGVFTKNRVVAAPVQIAAKSLKRGRAQAVLINSGNANACTGARGERNALDLRAALAEQLGIRPTLVVPASTGVIGVQLEDKLIRKALPDLVSDLSKGGVARLSRAILTTDRGPKVRRATFSIGKRKATVLGVAKGAGMIHPNMATTLAFVMTDAEIEPRWLSKSLRHNAELTFNRITVDGDTSTNDTIVAMASGQLGNTSIQSAGRSSTAWAGALFDVLEALAKDIVADGEGAEHLVRVSVLGARSDSDAVKVARTIASSQLVKTAIHGCDPNWGRVLGAAGRAGATFDPKRVSVAFDDVVVFRAGVPVMDKKTERRAARVMRAANYDLNVRLGRGRGKGYYWTCDLGHAYVSVNADYRS